MAVVWTFRAKQWNGDLRDLRGLLAWTLQSIAEPQFFVAGSAGAALLGGGWFAHIAHRNGSRWQGFVQACGTGIWPPVAASAIASLVLSNVVWGWTLGGGLLQPLFVPLVSVAPTIVLVYGPSVRVAATGVVLAVLLTTPASVLLVEYVCRPVGLPLVVGVTAGMALGAIAAFLLCRVLPWLPRAGAWLPRQKKPDVAVGSPRPAGPLWVLRRALADFSEAQFFGNEWASAAIIGGAIAAYILVPESLSYGSGLFPLILGSQVATAVLAVVVWRQKWKTRGFYPTFVPLVSTAPAAVLAYGGAVPPTIVAVVAGALVAPPLAAWISHRLPSDFHPFIGNVASMALSTAAIVPAAGLLAIGGS